MGKILIVAGLLIALAGVIVLLAGRTTWFGRLPGDIRIDRPGFSFRFPIATSILLSILLTIILNLFLRKR